MAVIPTSEDLGRRLAEPSGLAGTVNPRAFGYAPARAMADIGGEMAAHEDENAVFAARTRLNEWERANVHDAQTGAINRLGQDALAVPAELQRSFDAARADIAKSLGNERQRAAFERLAEARRMQVLDWADRHAIQQRNIYETGLFEADLRSSVDRAAASAGELPKVAAEMSAAGERIVAWGKARGWSAEQVQDTLRRQAGDMHAAVLDTILATDDWQRAEKYLKANAAQMDLRVVLRMGTALRKHADAVEGARDAQAAVQRMPLVADDVQRVERITQWLESGDRGDFAPDGTLLRSPKGAGGRMQVLDSTALDPGFGIRPAKRLPDGSIDVEDRARVGREYLGKLLQRYGGDLAKAWAAYNAGHGRVDAALAEAQREAGRFRGDMPADYWLQKMPAETRAYVARGLREFEQGGGAPPRPSLADVHGQIRRDGERLGHRPERVRVAMDEATRLYREQTDAIKVSEDAAVAEAMRQMLHNGGSWARLPPQVRRAVPPGEADNLMTFGQRVAKGDDRTNPAVYLALTNDRLLRGLSDDEFYLLRDELSEADWQSFAKQRASLQVVAADKSGELNTEAINTTLRNRLIGIGVDPTPKEGSDDAGRVAAIQRHVRDSLLQAQAAAGRRFDDAQTQAHIDQLFARTTILRDTFLGFDVGTSSRRTLSMKPGDIPAATRRALEADFRARGIEPTDSDILGAYWRLTGAVAGATSAARTGAW